MKTGVSRKEGKTWDCALISPGCCFLPLQQADLSIATHKACCCWLWVCLHTHTHSNNTQHHLLFLLCTNNRATPRFQKQQPVPVGPGSYEATGIYSNDSIRQTSLHKVCVHPAQQQKALPPLRLTHFQMPVTVWQRGRVWIQHSTLASGVPSGQWNHHERQETTAQSTKQPSGQRYLCTNTALHV